MKTWKEIEEEFDKKSDIEEVNKTKDFDNSLLWNERWPESEYEYAPDKILTFFKSQFKEIMEEMVGEECPFNACKCLANQYGFTSKRDIRQEMLDKINKFFE